MTSSNPDLGAAALVYIEKVRRATKHFGEHGGEDVRGVLQAVRGRADFDVEAPPSSARRDVALVKTGVKRVIVWYMRYLSAQLDAFAGDLVRLGEALAVKTERLDDGSDEVAAHLRAIDERLSRLEAGVAPRGAHVPARTSPPRGARKPRTAREN